MNRKEKDEVTVGDIRSVLLERLERQIDELNKLIRKGYHHRHEAEKVLNETIGKTLTELDNLDTWAGLPSLISNLKS